MLRQQLEEIAGGSGMLLQRVSVYVVSFPVLLTSSWPCLCERELSAEPPVEAMVCSSLWIDVTHRALWVLLISCTLMMKAAVPAKA